LISCSNYNGRIQLVQNEKLFRPLDADLQVPDTRKFTEHTGWNPRISFEQTMQDLLEYWRLKVKNKNYQAYWT
jgi:GDPmannose 4,6-dehydratase